MLTAERDGRPAAVSRLLLQGGSLISRIAPETAIGPQPSVRTRPSRGSSGPAGPWHRSRPGRATALPEVDPAGPVRRPDRAETVKRAVHLGSLVMADDASTVT